MSAHRNDKEDLLKAAKVELVNRFILTRKMHRFYAAETFRIFHKKWSNTVFAVGLIVSAGGIIGTVMLPGFWKIPGVVFILLGLYFLFMLFLVSLFILPSSPSRPERNLSISIISKSQGAWNIWKCPF